MKSRNLTHFSYVSLGLIHLCRGEPKACGERHGDEHDGSETEDWIAWRGLGGMSPDVVA